jgi:probable F420-dependent oxidoreductase
MKYGISLQSRGPAASPENLALVSRRAEELGFDSAFLGDHIVIPNSIASDYPYSATGSFSSAASGECLEQLTVLTFVAAKTQRLRLVPSVMILPHRNPLVAAKILATIDVLSKGRLTVGVGVGWLKEEFDALGIPPFEERGAVSNEYIQAFKELWTKDNPSFQGKYCRFSNIRFLPKPVQKPHPPIWIGGESPAALRRAAASGDAWHPIGSNPRYPLATAEQLKASVGRLTAYAKKARRDPKEIEVAYRVPRYLLNGGTHSQPFVGSARQVAQDIQAFAAAGANHLVFNFSSDDSGETLRSMEQFATQVMPQVVKS